jgi:HEAT repeat protein
MLEILRRVLPYIGGAIGVVILLVLLREVYRSVQRARWNRKKQRCRALVGGLKDLTPEQILALATDLKKTFPLGMVETVLFESYKDVAYQDLTTIFDQLGLVEHHLKALREAKSWPERANAAEKLGKIGHSRAVLPLITLLQDANEDREVKNAAMRALGKIHDERAIEPLIHALGLIDVSAGQPLADVLMQFGDMAIPFLIDVLSASKKETQRYWAARILGRSNPYGATSPLLNALSDHSAKVRAEACIALGHLRISEAVSPLVKIVTEDPVSLVREAAAEGLGKIADDRAIAALLESLADLDDAARRRALGALEKMGEKVSPFFLQALYEESGETQTQAATALERMGVVALWIDELDQEDWEPAFDRLSRIAKAGVVETLARALTDPRLRVRVHVCRVLSQGASPRTFEALSRAAQHDAAWVVRLEALIALSALGDVRAVPLFNRALLEEEAEPLREMLLVALQKAPMELIESVAPTVRQFLDDANINIRVEAIRVLACLHSDAIFSSVLASIEDSAPEVRREAASALGNYKQQAVGDGHQIMKLLIGALHDHEREVRIAAVKSLGKLQDPRAIVPLAETFERADESDRDDISAALASMPTEEFFQSSDVLMRLSDPKARAGIAWTLGLIGDPRGIALLTVLLKDPEPKVRASAAGAVARFGRKEVVPDLLACLTDPNERVRAAVVNALGQSGNVTAIERLLAMLDNEPDAFVRKRVALMIGVLSEQPSPQIADKIRHWLNSSTDAQSWAAGLTSLALLQDESSFQDILRAVQNTEAHTRFQDFLKGIPASAQNRFFSFLSLDPQLFWSKEEKKAGEHYSQLLQSSRDAQDRIRAISALSTLGDKSSAPAVDSAFTKDPSPAVRAAALEALGVLLRGDQLVAKIVQAAKDPSEIVRAQVVPAINQLRSNELREARKELLPLLDSSQAAIRKPVTELLAQAYAHDWQILADELGNAKQTRILGLVETLGKIRDPKIGSLFLQFMNHNLPEVRGAAALAAANAGFLRKHEWIPYLSDPFESLRFAAVRGLAKQLDDEVLRTFADHLEDPSVQIRREMASILGKHKLVGNEQAIDILRRLSQDENLPVRLISLISLFRLGVKGVAKDVGTLLPDIETEERREILETLKKEGIFIDLIKIIQHAHDIEERKEAIELITALDLRHHISVVVPSLQDPAIGVRVAAVEALAQVEDLQIQQAINALSQDPAEEVRNAVKRQVKAFE